MAAWSLGRQLHARRIHDRIEVLTCADGRRSENVQTNRSSTPDEIAVRTTNARESHAKRYAGRLSRTHRTADRKRAPLTTSRPAGPNVPSMDPLTGPTDVVQRCFRSVTCRRTGVLAATGCLLFRCGDLAPWQQPMQLTACRLRAARLGTPVRSVPPVRQVPLGRNRIHPPPSVRPKRVQILDGQKRPDIQDKVAAIGQDLPVFTGATPCPGTADNPYGTQTPAP